MTDEQLTVDWDDVACTLTPMTAIEYYETDPRTLPICEDHLHEMVLERRLEQNAPHWA